MSTSTTPEKAAQEVKKTAISYAMDWGRSPLPPTLLATLLTALHARPFRATGMIFPPVLLFSTYLNLQHFTVDSAGLTAAWSGLYLIMARRRTNGAGLGFKGRITNTFGARGLTRGCAMGLAAVNLVCGGLVYGMSKRETPAEKAV